MLSLSYVRLIHLILILVFSLEKIMPSSVLSSSQVSQVFTLYSRFFSHQQVSFLYLTCEKIEALIPSSTTRNTGENTLLDPMDVSYFPSIKPESL